MKLKKWLLLISVVVAAGIFTGCEMQPKVGFDDLEFSPDFKMKWAYSTSKYYEANDYLWVTVQSNYEDLGMGYSDYSKLDVKFLMTLSFEGNPECKVEMKSYDDCKSYNGKSLVLPKDVYSGKINYTIKLLSGEKSKEISGTYDWKTDYRTRDMEKYGTSYTICNDLYLNKGLSYIVAFPKSQTSKSEYKGTYTVKEDGKLWCEILSCAQDEGASITFTVNDGEYTPGMDVVADSKINVTFKFTKWKVTGLSPVASIFGAVVKSE